jgi:hypothetical protein
VNSEPHYDDIVIGSGLSALGVVIGLPSDRRVLVLAGPDHGSFRYYDSTMTVPSGYLGMGGLGNAWHGVIPLRKDPSIAFSEAGFAHLLDHFYPGASADAGRSLLFVPWRPIRPAAALRELAARDPQRLELSGQLALRIDASAASPRVQTPAGWLRCTRVWVAAGALYTPSLLERSFGKRLRRSHVADHVLCYVGHVDGARAPHIQRTRHGLTLEAFDSDAHTALYTLRPARFSFRTLDHGIEQRAAFGLPTGNAIAKIMRAMSAGLIVEALYNRFGLLASAPRHSVYAQIEVDRAYQLGADGTLRPDFDTLRARAQQAREEAPFAALERSRKPKLFIPGIHLHHSLDLGAVMKAGINTPASPIQVVDASALQTIGPEHHSFRMMVNAMERAQRM